MNIQQRLKRWFKLRFAIIYPLGVFAILFAHSTDDSIRKGIGFIIVGLLIRLWANGYVIKSERLTTCGPYAFVRHPLYLGTLLLVLGFIIMLRIYYIGGISLLIMGIVYYQTIRREEQHLSEKFSSDYLRYKEKVPLLFPTIFAYPRRERWPYSLKRLIKSKEYKLFLWMIILTIAFHLKDEFIVEHEQIDTKIFLLILLAFILGLSDLVPMRVWNRVTPYEEI